jgi:hypothetical protein
MPNQQKAPKRRRENPRVEGLPREQARKVLELLASRPSGLTILEIAARLRSPAVDVIRTLALMQRRQLLKTDSSSGRAKRQAETA